MLHVDPKLPDAAEHAFAADGSAVGVERVDRDAELPGRSLGIHAGRVEGLDHRFLAVAEPAP